MKNADAGGIGCFLVAILNSESLLGRADTPSSRASMSKNRASNNEADGPETEVFSGTGLTSQESSTATHRLVGL